MMISCFFIAEIRIYRSFIIKASYKSQQQRVGFLINYYTLPSYGIYILFWKRKYCNVHYLFLMGVLTGVFFMCLLQINRHNYENKEQQKK